MLKILLVIIYIAFISLGLPDAVMGSAWPMIHQDLNVPVSFAGAATIIVSIGTIISSLFSAKLIRKFGTGKITTISVLLTAAALLGVCFSPSFIWICILGIPLGIGAGAVDSALNNFVAINYEAKHMNWLHCFWGVGATSGPFIMSFFLLKQNGWRMGYATLGTMQAILVVCLFASLPLWKKVERKNEESEEDHGETKLLTLIKLPGVKAALITFFCYCSVELTTGLWASSFLVSNKGLTPVTAAKWVSLYYSGITLGRFMAGFVAMKLNNNLMIRIGQLICITGALFFMLPLPSNFQLIGLLLIGLGCAPIFPAMIHETPNRFGKEFSQGIIGIQMAAAYLGNFIVPPAFGAISQKVGFGILPYFLLVLMVIMLLAAERISKVCNTHKKVNS